MRRLELDTAKASSTALALALGKARRELCEVSEPRRVLGEVPLQPAHGGSLELRRSFLCVQIHELESVLERELLHLACRVAAKAAEVEMQDITAGSRIVVRSAAGKELPKIALTGIMMGEDFPVVWACWEKEWEAARTEGRPPEGVPGPPRTWYWRE
jgi:hypothetical protein